MFTELSSGITLGNMKYILMTCSVISFPISVFSSILFIHLLVLFFSVKLFSLEKVTFSDVLVSEKVSNKWCLLKSPSDLVLCNFTV